MLYKTVEYVKSWWVSSVTKPFSFERSLKYIFVNKSKSGFIVRRVKKKGLSK